MGCCIHPEFGGYFSIRAAIIMDSTEKTEAAEAKATLTQDEVTQILVELNTDWQKGIPHSPNVNFVLGL